MRNATLILTTVVIACCVIVPRAASGVIADAVRGTYELTAPVTTTGTFETEMLSMSLTPGGASVDLGGGTFNVDSFFDVFTELSVSSDPPTGTFRVDSFFDVFTELSIPGPPSSGIDTEIVALSLSGPVSMNVTPKLAGGEPTGTWDTEMISMSLSGGGPNSVIGPVEMRMGLPASGQLTATQVGASRFQIDSFFDVFTEISIAGGPFQPTAPAPNLRFSQSPSGQRCDNFQGNLTSNGMFGDGSGWNNGQWIEYPNSGDGGPAWYNQWFYNDPLDIDRFKEIFWDIVIEPVDPGDTGDIVEVAINWSNDQYPGGTGTPPDPSIFGETFIERFILGQYTIDDALSLKRIEGTDLPFIIDEYNPEWVSIDVRMLDQVSGLGVRVVGEICHECVPEPATMSLLGMGALALLRRRRKG